MPVKLGQDEKGCYAKWGEQGKEYYFECDNEQAKKIAEHKAKNQGQAIEISKKDFSKLNFNEKFILTLFN